MIEYFEIGELLEDLKSIKLPPERREFVNDARELLQLSGCLPVVTQTRLRKLVKLYRRQFEELHASRERARKTIWRMKSGITKVQAEEMIKQRRENVAKQKADLGI